MKGNIQTLTFNLAYIASIHSEIRLILGSDNLNMEAKRKGVDEALKKIERRLGIG